MAKVNARYALEAAGEIAKDGAAAVGIAATYVTPGMMPREWAEASFDKLNGKGYFEEHKKLIGERSATIESCEGALTMFIGVPISLSANDPLASLGALITGAYLVMEGVVRYVGFEDYKSDLPVSVISNVTGRSGEMARGAYEGVRGGAKRVGNYVSDTYHDVVEKHEGKE
jgi:hypothetical protein